MEMELISIWINIGRLYHQCSSKPNKHVKHWPSKAAGHGHSWLTSFGNCHIGNQIPHWISPCKYYEPKKCLWQFKKCCKCFEAFNGLSFVMIVLFVASFCWKFVLLSAKIFGLYYLSNHSKKLTLVCISFIKL